MDNNYFLPCNNRWLGNVGWFCKIPQELSSSCSDISCTGLPREDYEVAETQWVNVGLSVSLRERGQNRILRLADSPANVKRIVHVSPRSSHSYH